MKNIRRLLALALMLTLLLSLGAAGFAEGEQSAAGEPAAETESVVEETEIVEEAEAVEDAEPVVEEAPVEDEEPAEDEEPVEEAEMLTVVGAGERLSASAGVVLCEEGGTVFNNGATVYNNGGTVYNNFGVVFANAGVTYNNSGTMYVNGGEAYNNDGVAYFNPTGAEEAAVAEESEAAEPVDAPETEAEGEEAEAVEVAEVEAESEEAEAVEVAEVEADGENVEAVEAAEVEAESEEAELSGEQAAALEETAALEEASAIVKSSIEGGVVVPGQAVTLSAEDGAEIRYTLDGSEPDGESALYAEPIVLEKSATLKARVWPEGETLTLDFTVPSVTVAAFEPLVQGYKKDALTAAAATVTNDGAEPIVIKAARLNGPNSLSFTLDAARDLTVECGESNDSAFLITPKLYLRPGVYEASLVLILESGETFAVPFSLTVEKP